MDTILAILIIIFRLQLLSKGRLLSRKCSSLFLVLLVRLTITLRFKTMPCRANYFQLLALLLNLLRVIWLVLGNLTNIGKFAKTLVFFQYLLADNHNEYASSTAAKQRNCGNRDQNCYPFDNNRLRFNFLIVLCRILDSC